MSLRNQSLFARIWSDPDRGDPPWYLGRYFIICCVMIAVTLLYPMAQSYVGIILLRLMFTAILLSALYTAIRKPRLYRGLLLLLIPTLLANWIVNPGDHPGLIILSSSATLFILIAAIGVILHHIIAARRVSEDIIFGSVAAYLLFGLLWAMAYELLNVIMPGMVISSAGEILTAQERATQFSDFMYFSFITLTSVGYGDLTPIGTPARALAMVEGIFGQLYTAILIAWLVGVRVAQE